MSVTYDRITNSTTDSIDYVASPTYTNMYPDSNTISIYGPIWLPRVYGKDLTAFEIASSGKIAITISDIHTLDLSNGLYSGASNTMMSTLNTKSNYAFELMANNRQVRMTMDSYNNDILIHADSNIRMSTSSNDLVVDIGNDTVFMSKCNIDITADHGSFRMVTNESNMFIKMLHTESNISVYSSSNMSTYVQKDYIVTASNDMMFNVHEDVTVTAKNGNLQLNTNIDNMYLRMMKDTSNMQLYSSCNMSFGASNMLDIDITSPPGSNGGLFVAVNAQSNYLKIDGNNDARLYVMNSIFESACNDFVMHAGDDMSITACNNANTLIRNSFVTTACNDYTVRTGSNLNLVAQDRSLYMYANASNMWMTMNDGPKTIDIYSKSNINHAADNGWYKITAHRSNVTLFMNDPLTPCNMDGYATCNITFTASNNTIIKTLNDLSTFSVTGNTSIYAESNMYLTAHQSNVYLRMTMPTDTFVAYALSNMSFTTSNALSLTARTNASLTASNIDVVGYCNIHMTASNNMYVKSVNDLEMDHREMNITARADITCSARSNMNFYVQSAPVFPGYPVFQVTGNEVRVRGDLVITGTLNTSNITTTDVLQANLKVNDKVIILASVGSNDATDGLPADGLATNDKSGIIIDGLPSTVNSNVWDMYRKSFVWNLGTNGTLDLGTSNITTESFWELQGGSFRITQKKNIGTTSSPQIVDVSFGFRINESEELELVKKFYSPATSNYVFRRVAKFGRIL